MSSWLYIIIYSTVESKTQFSTVKEFRTCGIKIELKGKNTKVCGNKTEIKGKYTKTCPEIGMCGNTLFTLTNEKIKTFQREYSEIVLLTLINTVLHFFYSSSEAMRTRYKKPSHRTINHSIFGIPPKFWEFMCEANKRFHIKLIFNKSFHGLCHNCPLRSHCASRKISVNNNLNQLISIVPLLLLWPSFTFFHLNFI